MKIKNAITNNKYPIIASFISFCIMLFIYIINGITPFGDQSLLSVDLFHQYAPMLANFMDKLEASESLIYSIGAGLGATFLGNVINYMGSPFNIIIILAGKAYIQESIALIILLKAMLSTFTFTYVANKLSKVNNKMIIPFGLMYTFSAFFVAYFWNIMWFDAVYMLPIIALGIYKLIYEDKKSLYIASLAFSIIVNYYMGYMLCISSVIIFLVLYFMKHNLKDTMIVSKNGETKNKSLFINKCMKFAIASLTVGALAAFVLIPVYSVLQNSSAISGEIKNQDIYFSPMEFLANHMSFSTITFRSNYYAATILPNVFFGMLPFAIFPFYFTNEKISKKEKYIVAIVALFFYASFAVSIIDYVWHGFHFPNDIPYRFSYVYVFLMLLTAIRGYTTMEAPKKKTAIALLSIPLGIFLIVGLFFAPNKTLLTIPATLLLIIIYGALLYMHKKTPLKSIFSVLMVALVVLEVSLPCISSMETVSKNEFAGYTNDINEIKEVIGDEDWYRMEIMKNKTWNDGLVYNYNGITSFSSLNYEHTTILQKYLGVCANSLNTVKYCPQTPIYNMMFGVNYTIDNFENNMFIPDDRYVNLLHTTSGNLKLFESKYPTSIGFSVTGDVSNPNEWNYKMYSPFANQKSFIKFATGLDNSVIYLTDNYTFVANGMEVTYDHNDNPNQEFKYVMGENIADAYTKITTTVEEEGHYYAFVLTRDFDVTYDTPNQDKYTQSCTTSYIYTHDIGRLNAGDSFDAYLTATAKVDVEGTFNYFVCKMNDEVINDAYNTIKNNGILNVVEHKDDYIKANIDTETGNIYTSIPYDLNWKVLVDGKEIDDSELYVVGGSLIGLQVEKGEHNIEFIYETPNMLPGIIISSTALVACIIAYIIEKRRQNAKV